jgi:hypothetical protein
VEIVSSPRRVAGGRERPAASSPLAAGGGRGRRGWEVSRSEVRVSGFWVVEAAEPGGDDDGGGGGVRVRVRESGSPANLELRVGRGAAGGPAVKAARPADGQGPAVGEKQAVGLGRAGSPAGVDGERAAQRPPAGAGGGGGGGDAGGRR